MGEIFAVRNVDVKTRQFIYKYANEHGLNAGQALRQLVVLVQEHLTELEQKYKTIFDTYKRIAFRSDTPNLSQQVDKILYEENQ